ncbi:hypothetical protein LTR35_009572 [Friedmanniomyces endolithicus]|uniref:Cytochrome P450 n=1 Tax=Friedmanniomyces endolithicus TaxID=329885 RepID=A0AAN6J985_9PEZI|nr:hypothetical protein LTR35_009572 [Friedmanniomyces endolithicus]KAK0301221.1 hypothetical protein LTS00_000370 [Friedmanniomyces endolithicus]KAK0321187.1 hypothetical protein LTR82_007639 [Friedmanniomyces endolithicus]
MALDLGPLVTHPPLLLAASVLLSPLIHLRACLRSRRTSHIPGIRYGALPLLGPWIGAYHFLRDPEAVLREGHAQHPTGCFKVATLTDEIIIASGQEKFLEYIAAPDSVLNGIDAINSAIQFEWTMGAGVYHRPYHIALVRGKLTQGVGKFLPDMQVEVDRLLREKIGEPQGWEEVDIHEAMINMIATTVNMALGGTRLAHDQAYIKEAIQYTFDMMFSAELVRSLPAWAKELAMPFTPVYRNKKRCEKMIGEYIEERLRATESGKVDTEDILQWLIDAAPAEERTMVQLNERLLSFQVAAIHTTTVTLTNAIYTLCAQPELYLDPLRAEIRQHCKDGKFTKETLDRLTKVDSFLRECGRTGPIGTVASGRYARSDFHFKDGTLIPQGCMVFGNTPVLHRIVSEEEARFDGFRSSRLAEGGEGTKQPQLVSTGGDNLNFGHGRHACPGRFFAAAEVKLILTKLILRYDMELIPGTKPMRMYIGTTKIPETKLKIRMRAATS